MGACCEALGLPIPLLSTEYPNYLTWRNGRKSEAVVVPAPISDARRVRAAVGLLLTPLPDAAKKTGPSLHTLPRPPPPYQDTPFTVAYANINLFTLKSI